MWLILSKKKKKEVWVNAAFRTQEVLALPCVTCTEGGDIRPKINIKEL